MKSRFEDQPKNGLVLYGTMPPVSTLTDTLTAAQALQDAGVEKSQAEAHVRVIAQIVKETQGDFATKADINGLASDIKRLESEMRTIKWMVASGFVILALMIALRPVL